jgi:hypothetical protein
MTRADRDVTVAPYQLTNTFPGLSGRVARRSTHVSASSCRNLVLGDLAAYKSTWIPVSSAIRRRRGCRCANCGGREPGDLVSEARLVTQQRARRLRSRRAAVAGRGYARRSVSARAVPVRRQVSSSSRRKPWRASAWDTGVSDPRDHRARGRGKMVPAFGRGSSARPAASPTRTLLPEERQWTRVL